ncbi:hypothetical protein [Flavobacterium tistrianum]|uniref:hypothetical protein n=1 Tax=Flavobacterium tistrianum TaxID=1685414 RepID=UPI0013A66E83|nr:hypothetical protein [Flavobacterium tistrianum]KAF2339221.1 hypothetical protein DMB71_17185 [Flavobacterium tistrianum]
MSTKVYRTHIGFKIFGLLFSLPLLIVCTGILLIPVVPVPANTIMSEMQKSWPPLDYLFYLLLIGLIGINLLALIMLIASFRKKVIITDKSIIITNVFITRKVEFKEVEDAYIQVFNLCLETKNKKKICLNLVGLKTIDLEDVLYKRLKKI